MNPSHADLAGLWETAGSEHPGHVPGAERYHFPVAGTLWIERRGASAELSARRYELCDDGFNLGGGGAPERVTAWIEAGFLVLRGADEHETWCRRIVSGLA